MYAIGVPSAFSLRWESAISGPRSTASLTVWGIGARSRRLIERVRAIAPCYLCSCVTDGADAGRGLGARGVQASSAPKSLGSGWEKQGTGPVPAVARRHGPDRAAGLGDPGRLQ